MCAYWCVLRSFVCIVYLHLCFVLFGPVYRAPEQLLACSLFVLSSLAQLPPPHTHTGQPKVCACVSTPAAALIGIWLIKSRPFGNADRDPNWQLQLG